MSVNKLKIIVISNFVFDIYFTSFMEQLFEGNVIVSSIPYEEYKSIKYQKKLLQANMIITWLNYELLYNNNNVYLKENKDDESKIVKVLIDFYNELKEKTSCNIVGVLFEDYYSYLPKVLGYCYEELVDRLNMELYCALSNDITFIDLKRLIAQIGIESAYDERCKYRWNSPYSKKLIRIVTEEIHKQYLIENGITKKCVVLDCDNVLWGGEVSEDGIENVKLGSSGIGKSYQDFQRFILSLYYHGIILAICSKNDLQDVLTMFQSHDEMILKEEHIACFQVNWKNKSNNIKQIAECLNIGLDSIVFIDDSYFEIEEVKKKLPNVTTVLYDKTSVYDKLSCFNLKSNIQKDDVERRNKTYKTNILREKLQESYSSFDEYIKSLDVKVDIHAIRLAEFNRVSELSQRTNRYTNGKRYKVTDIKNEIGHNEFYSVSMSDRFSNFGLVGAVAFTKNNISLFTLSCRALGKKIEEEMIAFIKQKCHIVTIEFKQTDKNGELKKLLENNFPTASFTSLTPFNMDLNIK